MRGRKGLAIGPRAAEHRWSLSFPTYEATGRRSVTCGLGGNRVLGQALTCPGGAQEERLFVLRPLFLPAVVSLDFMRRVVSHLRQDLITA